MRTRPYIFTILIILINIVILIGQTRISEFKSEGSDLSYIFNIEEKLYLLRYRYDGKILISKEVNDSSWVEIDTFSIESNVKSLHLNTMGKSLLIKAGDKYYTYHAPSRRLTYQYDSDDNYRVKYLTPFGAYHLIENDNAIRIFKDDSLVYSVEKGVIRWITQECLIYRLNYSTYYLSKDLELKKIDQDVDIERYEYKNDTLYYQTEEAIYANYVKDTSASDKVIQFDLPVRFGQTMQVDSLVFTTANINGRNGVLMAVGSIYNQLDTLWNIDSYESIFIQCVIGDYLVVWGHPVTHIINYKTKESLKVSNLRNNYVNRKIDGNYLVMASSKTDVFSIKDKRHFTLPNNNINYGYNFERGDSIYFYNINRPEDGYFIIDALNEKMINHGYFSEGDKGIVNIEKQAQHHSSYDICTIEGKDYKVNIDELEGFEISSTDQVFVYNTVSRTYQVHRKGNTYTTYDVTNGQQLLISEVQLNPEITDVFGTDSLCIYKSVQDEYFLIHFNDSQNVIYLDVGGYIHILQDRIFFISTNQNLILYESGKLHSVKHGVGEGSVFEIEDKIFFLDGTLYEYDFQTRKLTSPTNPLQVGQGEITIWYNNTYAFISEVLSYPNYTTYLYSLNSTYNYKGKYISHDDNNVYIYDRLSKRVIQHQLADGEVTTFDLGYTELSNALYYEGHTLLFGYEYNEFVITDINNETGAKVVKVRFEDNNRLDTVAYLKHLGDLYLFKSDLALIKIDSEHKWTVIDNNFLASNFYINKGQHLWYMAKEWEHGAQVYYLHLGDPTAINEIDYNSNNFLAPNPAPSHFDIIVDNIHAVEVYDLHGRQVWIGHESSVSCESWGQGTYIVKVVTVDEKVLINKFVKM